MTRTVSAILLHGWLCLFTCLQLGPKELLSVATQSSLQMRLASAKMCIPRLS
ncbi:hypothetical protein CGRA01v4_03470 [Colletotrichum graminicola]|nr:hypothetical protein CGRA01v4_03470 [Colletotrichum graminicola]